MSKVTIEKVFRGKKETKFGQKDSIAIKVKEISVNGINVDGRWLSSFKVRGTEGWADGDTVDVSVVENKGYLNFEPMDANSLEARVERLEKAVFGGKADVTTTVEPTKSDLEAYNEQNLADF